MPLKSGLICRRADAPHKIHQSGYRSDVNATTRSGFRATSPPPHSLRLLLITSGRKRRISIHTPKTERRTGPQMSQIAINAPANAKGLGERFRDGGMGWLCIANVEVPIVNPLPSSAYVLIVLELDSAVKRVIIGRPPDFTPFSGF